MKATLSNENLVLLKLFKIFEIIVSILLIFGKEKVSKYYKTKKHGTGEMTQYVLLLQRTQVQFLARTSSSSQLPVTSAPRNLTHFCFPWASAHTHKHTHTHRGLAIYPWCGTGYVAPTGLILTAILPHQIPYFQKREMLILRNKTGLLTRKSKSI